MCSAEVELGFEDVANKTIVLGFMIFLVDFQLKVTFNRFYFINLTNKLFEVHTFCIAVSGD